MSQRIKQVAIVGAGPVGLLGALELARLGISVDVFDLLEGVDRRPRAAGYGPSAVRLMGRAGVLDRIRQEGLELYDYCWRKPSGEYIAGIKGVFNPNREDRYVTMPVDQMIQIIYEALQKYPIAKVHWRHKFTGFEQDKEQVVIFTEYEGQTRTFKADFLLGCDGARSGVRKALFGRHFPGHTWDVQIVATNLHFPDGRMEKHGWKDALLLDPGLQRIEQASRDPATAQELFEASDNLTVDMAPFYDLKLKEVNGIAVTVSPTVNLPVK
ncbi:FAD binding domain-containing protein [Cladophialophora immunda]|nr:FAD binding domain-containing protein [Cladophialophora immunda]